MSFTQNRCDFGCVQN